MESKELIFRIMYLALIEIREEAYETKNKKIFHLSDIFHNVPLQINNVLENKGTYEDIIKWLHNRANENGCEGWLYNAYKNIGHDLEERESEK